jgi:hypothetical protein
MVLLGVGAGLAIPAATESVMGSLPRGDTGVGSATNGTFMQVGGALRVAVIGSLLAARYQGRMTAALARPSSAAAISGSALPLTAPGAGSVSEDRGPQLRMMAKSC